MSTEVHLICPSNLKWSNRYYLLGTYSVSFSRRQPLRGLKPLWYLDKRDETLLIAAGILDHCSSETGIRSRMRIGRVDPEHTERIGTNSWNDTSKHISFKYFKWTVSIGNMDWHVWFKLQLMLQFENVEDVRIHNSNLYTLSNYSMNFRLRVYIGWVDCIRLYSIQSMYRS